MRGLQFGEQSETRYETCARYLDRVVDMEIEVLHP